MAGFEDTRQKIISTLMGRPVGTEIQPENQQDYELNMLDYIRSLELIATSTLIGLADSNTVPVQPNSSRVCYISGIAQNRTVVFENFMNENGTPISITTGDMEGVLVILMWNTQYWSAQTINTNIISQSQQAIFYYRYNIRKTYSSISNMNADKTSPIGTDGKYIKIGDIVTVENPTTPSENGIYSYEGSDIGWRYQSSFNFQLSQFLGDDPNISVSQKTLTSFINKKNDIKTGKNLFNPDAKISGKYLFFENDSYGIGNNSDYYISDYIPIDSNGLFVNKSIADTPSFICHVYYDINKNPIGNSRNQNIAFLLNAAYVRFTLKNEYGTNTNIQIESGNSETSYEPYSPILGYWYRFFVTNDLIVSKAVSVDKTDFVTTGKNLFNPETVVIDSYISGGTGQEVSAAGWWHTDYIRIKPNTKYSSINPGVRDRAFYDSNKNFISGNSDKIDNFTTPSNAAFVRYSQYQTDYNKSILNEGEIIPFEAFYYKFVGLNEQNLQQQISLLNQRMTLVENVVKTLGQNVSYEELTYVITRTSTEVRVFTDIAGVGAYFNKVGSTFNGIRLHSAQRSNSIPNNRVWRYAQVFVKNTKEDTEVIAKSPIISIDSNSLTVNDLIFPLMDANLENFVTLNDSSFVGDTYFVYHQWYNADMSFAYAGTTQGDMSNYAGTSFYSTDLGTSFGPYSGNLSIALEHLLLTNPSIYATVPVLEEKIKDLQQQISLLQPENIEIILPDKIYAIVGDTLQLFYRGIIKAWNPYQYDIVINCSKGAWFPRYFEYTPVVGDIGTTNLQIKVKDNNGRLLGSKTCQIITKNSVQSPTSNLKTLFIGDSLTNAGIYTQEAFRRLTGTGGTPSGKGFNNIEFVGRKPYGTIMAEGNSGWSWGDYLTVGRKAYTFTITAPTVMPAINSVYKDSNNKTYTMWWDYSTTSVKMLVDDMVSTPPASGTLTKVSGTGDSTITYSNFVQSSGNPFWNDQTSQVDFKNYVDKWLSGTVNVVYTLLTWNGQYGNRTDFSNFLNYAKDLFRNIHSNYPNVLIKMMGVQVSDLRGGVRVDGTPSENTYTDTYGLAVTALNMNKAYQELANDLEFSSYVEFINVSSQVDSEYNMPFVEKQVNTRFSGVTEKIGTNDVHPNADGYNQIADVVFRNFVANFCQ